MLAPGGARFVLFPAAAALVLTVGVLVNRSFAPYLLGGGAVVAGGLAVFLAWFFRDPERAPGPDIVSAADGIVQTAAVEGDRWHLAVFMNVTDVHVNRFPLDAEVLSIENAGSGFRPAYGEDAAHNVRRHYRLATAVGPVEVVQLTGIVARRLISLVEVGAERAKGDRLGMIVLGSRVDVYLPSEKVVPIVTPGQRVIAGVTPIARARP